MNSSNTSRIPFSDRNKINYPKDKNMAERPEDLNLPITVVQRIIKEALPDGVVVSKEARQTISRASSVFVLYLTACAVTHANKGKRKTLAVNDIFSALEDMEFDAFLAPLKESLKSRKDATVAAATSKKTSQASANNGNDATSPTKKTSANQVSAAKPVDDDDDDNDDVDEDADDYEEIVEDAENDDVIDDEVDENAHNNKKMKLTNNEDEENDEENGEDDDPDENKQNFETDSDESDEDNYS